MSSMERLTHDSNSIGELSMRPFRLAISAGLVALLVIAVMASCAPETHKNVRHGAFLFPHDEQYSVVILEGALLQEAFGPGWQRRRLYYGYSGGFSNGVELATSQEPLSMLSVHPPVLVIAGNRWNVELPVLIYDAEADEQVAILVDMVKPAIHLKSQRRKREGRTQEHFLEDGRLMFRWPSDLDAPATHAVTAPPTRVKSNVIGPGDQQQTVVEVMP